MNMCVEMYIYAHFWIYFLLYILFLIAYIFKQIAWQFSLLKWTQFTHPFLKDTLYCQSSSNAIFNKNN